ncbi:hypothetical protein IAD21_04044 [Abditibacteriota bacterium]|nr:hypothetical protein IAD21_04044 [Abditibacteriota bacterium]
MFESELRDLRVRMEKIGRKSGRIHFNPPATPEQISQFERTLGIELPLQFREFLLQVTLGCCVGVKEELQLGPIIPDNNDGFRFNYGGGGFPVVFPLQHVLYDEYQYRLKGWNDLSGHEKMESYLGFCFAVWGPFRLAVIVLSGEERGSVWHGANYSGEAERGGASFLEAFDKMLDKTK